METSTYKYINSFDYINKLSFDYIITYSLQRGQVQSDFEKSINREITDLTQQLQTPTSGHLKRQKRLAELEQYKKYTQYLYSSKGEIHPTSVKTSTLSNNDPQVKKLVKILQTPIQEVPSWMCTPFYRDAIVFYDNKDQIVSILNVCLGCEYMQIDSHTFIDADNSTYTQLREFFIDLGHQVEDKGSP